MLRSHCHSILISLIAAVSIPGALGAADAATCYGQTNCSLGSQAYTFGPNDVYGGGSSVGAPWWRQVSDCYANAADLITTGRPPTYVDTQLFDFRGRSPQNCASTEVNPGPTTWYVSTASGSGILGLFGHDPQSFWGEVNVNGPQYFPTVSYALSEAGLTHRIVNVYDAGTGDKSYCVQKNACISVAAPGQISCTGGSNNPYPNPASCYGQVVQFPISVDPIAIFYTHGGVYEKIAGPGEKEIDYKLNVENPTGNGGLDLSITSLCGIYTGRITNWNDPSLTADNGGASLEDPRDLTPPSQWNVPLQPAGRSDASGSTLAITRHLATVCGDLHLKPAMTLERAGLHLEAACDKPKVGILVAAGSNGIAQCVNFSASPNGIGNACTAGTVLPNGYTDCIQQGRVGYIGSDYVLPYVSSNGTNAYGLYVARVENHRGEFVSPSPAAALIAFRAAGLPPQTDAMGNYCPTCGALERSDPWAWNPQKRLADPREKGAYPITSTTNFLGYSCYASASRLANLTGQLTYLETTPINVAKKGIPESSGLGALPNNWRKAIEQTFLNNSDGLGLQMTTVGGSTNCSASGIVGA